MVNTANALRDEGLNIEDVSCGSSPTGKAAAAIEGVTEVRPGTYIFNDAVEVSMDIAAIEECAAEVVYTVVNTNNPGRIIIDGGYKSISSDVSINTAPYYLDSYGICKRDAGARLAAMNEEHGIVLLGENAKSYKVGDKISFIPNHICTCINLYDFLYLKDKNGVTKYSIKARGMLH